MATKESAHEGAKSTVIGQSILINGKLTGDEDLTVQGRVEGELTLTKTLIIESSGVVKANVAVKNAIVSGVVVGNVNATESVELTKEGRMVGDIRAPRVIVVDGASFKGHVDMGEVEPGRINADRSRGSVRATVRPSAAPSRSPVPATKGGKPLPPPPPSQARTESRGDVRVAPLPPVMAAGAKKRVIIKKKPR